METHTAVLVSDTPEEAARKIFDHFEVLQSCTIRGIEIGDGELISKGSLVLKELAILDKANNWYKAPDGRWRRKRKIEPNSIGDKIAGKIFKYKETVLEDTVSVAIWRLQ